MSLNFSPIVTKRAYVRVPAVRASFRWPGALSQRVRHDEEGESRISHRLHINIPLCLRPVCRRDRHGRKHARKMRESRTRKRCACRDLVLFVGVRGAGHRIIEHARRGHECEYSTPQCHAEPCTSATPIPHHWPEALWKPSGVCHVSFGHGYTSFFLQILTGNTTQCLSCACPQSACKHCKLGLSVKCHCPSKESCVCVCVVECKVQIAQRTDTNRYDSDTMSNVLLCFFLNYFAHDLGASPVALVTSTYDRALARSIGTKKTAPFAIFKC